jgi:hypothetical protein
VKLLRSDGLFRKKIPDHQQKPANKVWQAFAGDKFLQSTQFRKVTSYGNIIFLFLFEPVYQRKL